ncbi:zinc ribbon domain-containing protein [Mycobacterium sp. CVI_P3]|uniref:Zinc ribbon domain-containing protein n=1 Tax=Mycobacterium pinniadriaticum TaxID=2994102 RepID=A0ABT3SA92_9MYCO|nr:zinc ribbon domain-containing protein [Mycobacterium pinniadriaticum]MCX2929358.1 zinc ribbon domain-containing protein [Mycobacterium pinniadriaticum]MCX2935782.1 zinc ribbon domain-containing protein [Mycobacterium pinniadriaticum]
MPTAAFCSDCGADLRGPEPGSRAFLRPKAFAVAPREPVYLPMVTSSLFPRLPERIRTPFRHGMALLLTALVGFSMLRLLGPLVITASLGAELLFVLYLWQSDVFRDMPRRAWLLAPVLGVVFGVGWWLWTGQIVADSYDIPLGVSSQLQHVINFGLVITLAGIVPMLLPVVVVRLLRLPTHESLDGFVTGALGALFYSGAGTLTWFAPQFTTDILADYGPWRLLEEAILYGFVDPVTAASLGGLLGLTLWMRVGRPRGRGRVRPRTALAILTVIALLVYTAVYMVDAAQLERTAELVANVALAAIALVTLRAGLQIALLNEEPDPPGGEPIVCTYCQQVVPDMPFCPLCGAAARASSRSTRLRRRTAAPVEEDTST